jgi:ribosomal protein L9
MINKILETCKKYWYMFAIFALTGVVLLVGFVENSKVAGLSNMIKKIADGYVKQFDKLETLNDAKTKKDKKIIAKAEKKIAEIEKDKEEKIQKVLEEKEKVVEKLKDSSAEELAKKLKEEYKL